MASWRQIDLIFISTFPFLDFIITFISIASLKTEFQSVNIDLLNKISCLATQLLDTFSMDLANGVLTKTIQIQFAPFALFICSILQKNLSSDQHLISKVVSIVSFHLFLLGLSMLFCILMKTFSLERVGFNIGLQVHLSIILTFSIYKELNFK